MIYAVSASQVWSAPTEHLFLMNARAITRQPCATLEDAWLALSDPDTLELCLSETEALKLYYSGQLTEAQRLALGSMLSRHGETAKFLRMLGDTFSRGAY